VPVEEYLVRQQRFRHLFEPHRNETELRAIQARVDAYWQRIE
jgi:pyruvate ferredoxin oxidoreductase beta subunit